jgi:hypothetical protein
VEINPSDQSSNGINISVSYLNDFLTPTDAGKKMSRALRDGRPLARLGAWLLLFTAEVLLGGKPGNCSQKSVSFPGRVAR